MNIRSKVRRLMAKNVTALIIESGAAGGDLVYIRLGRGEPLPGIRLITAPDLLGLKAEAFGMDEPLIASGPTVDETFADVVIDAESSEPTIVKAKRSDAQNGTARARLPAT
jgi:hypothetical protein